jgi:hypothetical protein
MAIRQGQKGDLRVLSRQVQEITQEEGFQEGRCCEDRKSPQGA